ncbi:wsv223 [White spot syndrome virus]|uniref:Wsv223 n=4 Tax=White spot syndrome virus TaxID=342409 RepID=Q8VAZ3_WSSVS|nr:wsv223 [Shrimp white spot syndrome virus]AFX59600.1 wsv223 [White spot syndrome virus]AAL33227.1 wsv223 [Shrimp white spot syndrome virus]AAL89146.1 WSSV278 [Shrimp white spot syndrome virus]AWQ60394.1 wsv223 [Shrimp white spot syndrome virus]AWQ60809.1 wsv223 [Shrimp white spot syndrome virus]
MRIIIVNNIDRNASSRQFSKLAHLYLSGFFLIFQKWSSKSKRLLFRIEEFFSLFFIFFSAPVNENREVGVDISLSCGFSDGVGGNFSCDSDGSFASSGWGEKCPARRNNNSGRFHCFHLLIEFLLFCFKKYTIVFRSLSQF